mmetsp:Transcript_29617/g.48874  ORF Transcript_29617/g.48874 Transcript_29617/m.48874 type:complete len:247 (-) Transcript_29617:569-1309(-)
MTGFAVNPELGLPVSDKHSSTLFQKLPRFFEIRELQCFPKVFNAHRGSVGGHYSIIGFVANALDKKIHQIGRQMRRRFVETKERVVVGVNHSLDNQDSMLTANMTSTPRRRHSECCGQIEPRVLHQRVQQLVGTKFIPVFFRLFQQFLFILITSVPRVNHLFVLLLQYIITAVYGKTTNHGLALIEFVQITMLQQDTCMRLVDIQHKVSTNALYRHVLTDCLELIVRPLKVFFLDVSILDEFERFL